MEKREKILLGVMAAVALGGGVMMLIGESAPPASRPAAASGPKAGEIAASTQAAIREGSLNSDESYVLEAAIREWRGNPFYDWELSGQTSPDEKAMTEEAAKYSYTGYIDVGGKLVAVINGLEYETGEELATGGFVVREIGKSNVVLESTGKRIGLLTLPYAGEVY